MEQGGRMSVIFFENSRVKIPVILPVVHGTSLNVAWKICATGFANLSCLVSICGNH